MKRTILLGIATALSLTLSAQSSDFKMGTSKSPDGSTWTLDAQSLLHNGKRIIPVMGEIHYTRVPESQWRTELLRMKAGGVNVIANYVFWIHHEELENQYDWSGNRNLHKFVSLCKELNLPVILRIGPFCHGEVRNGGIPEWVIQQNYKIRTTEPHFLAKVENWYRQVYTQVQGMLWKDGGPVIGIQLDNEFSGPWNYLMTLKNIAREIGLDTPIYTRTGWPLLSTPAAYGEIIPLYGDYSDGFWNRELTDMPGDYRNCYFFKSYRGSTVIATEQLKGQKKEDAKGELSYPFLTCELGGGMMTSYHRRIYIHPMDIYATALVKVGNGSNLPGYYMYHGGTNPEGKLTTLNEMQRTLVTNYNDLPMKTYDFQAPIGEFGQLNEQYHMLRNLHMFLQDFGEELATMNPSFPVAEAPNYDWDGGLRWNYRSNGHSGFIFVNNYQRMKTLTDKTNVTFTVPIDGKDLSFPSKKITIPSGESFFIPFNMNLNGTNLKYALAQPLTKIESNGVTIYFFKQLKGIPAEFAFDSSVKTLKAGTGIAFAVNKKTQIILLDEQTALNCWKGNWAGEERIFLSKGSLTYDHNSLAVEDNTSDFDISVFPAPQEISYNGTAIKAQKNGIFSHYHIATGLPVTSNVALTKKQDAGSLRTITLGIAKAAEEPKDEDFDQAAVWTFDMPKTQAANQRALLTVNYKGDVARLYDGNKFLDDNFYNGRPFLYDLNRLPSSTKELSLKILPLQKDAPIYIQKEFQFDMNGQPSMIKDVSAQITYLNKIELKVMAPKNISFAKGADISWTTQYEQEGRKFYNEKGEQKECTALMQELRMNTIRLRVWVNPKDYWSSKEDMLTLAKRADALGMGVMVDFHYSDNWADPGKQIIPAAWKDYSYEQMKEAVAKHTRETLQLLKDNNIYPTWVQVGNETSHGMLWDMGNNHKNMEQYVGLNNAGYDAVKSVFPRTICIVHLDNGFDAQLYNRVFDGMKQYGGKYDLIGMSLYPYWAAKSDPMLTADKILKDCMNNITALYKKYKKECMIVETGTQVDTPESSKAFMMNLMKEAKANPHCKGVLYWEPECESGYELGSFKDGRATIALDAFK